MLNMFSVTGRELVFHECMSIIVSNGQVDTLANRSETITHTKFHTKFYAKFYTKFYAKFYVKFYAKFHSLALLCKMVLLYILADISRKISGKVKQTTILEYSLAGVDFLTRDGPDRLCPGRPFRF